MIFNLTMIEGQVFIVFVLLVVSSLTHFSGGVLLASDHLFVQMVINKSIGSLLN